MGPSNHSGSRKTWHAPSYCPVGLSPEFQERDVGTTCLCCQSKFTITEEIHGFRAFKNGTFCATLKHFENRAHVPTQKSRESDLLAFPAAMAKEEDASGGDGGFRDDDGDVDAIGAHAQGDGEEIGQGNFQEPEAEEVHHRGRHGISRTVEGLEHDHAVGIADVAVAENSQAGDGQRDDERIAGEEMDNRFGEDFVNDTAATEKDHVVNAGAPDGSFRALGLLGAKVLADERGGGVAEAPARKDGENKYANGDGIAGEGCGAEDADDADEANPTGVGDGELQNAGERHAEQ